MHGRDEGDLGGAPITGRAGLRLSTVWIAAAALWLGCLLPGPWLLLPGGVVLAFAAQRFEGRRRVLAIVAALLLLGSGAAGARAALMETGPLWVLAQGGGEADMTGLVVSEPRPSQTGAWLLLRVATVNRDGSGRRAMLRFDHLDDAPPLGATVALRATARPLADEEFEGYLRRLHARVAIDPVGPTTVVRGPPDAVAATTVVRERMRSAAAEHLPGDHAALLSGLVTGDTSALSPSAQDSLRAAGLSHLVAVSGSNVALVLAGTLGLAGCTGLGARGRRRVAVAALIWFVILVRAEPSVLRAGVMAGLVVASAALGRGHDARHTLGMTTVLLLLVDPLLAGQLGFVLSVLATAGVLIATPLITPRVPGPRSLATLVGASAGAQLAVAPVLLTTEGGVALGGLPANLLAVPLAAVASAVGVTAAVVSQVWVPAGAGVSALAWPALSGVLWAGRTFASAPAITAAHLASPVVVAVLVAAVVRHRAPRLAFCSVVLALAVTLAAPWASAPDVEGLTLTALGVGQGDALLVEVPSAGGSAPARMLVDGGPDQGLALKLLRERGVRFLDAVVLSHPHADHTDGLPAVVARMRTATVVAGPQRPRELDDAAASAEALEAVAAQRGVPVLRAGAGQRFALGRATVEILSPPADGSLGTEPNDNSLVLRVVDGEDSLLLTGDAEEAAQQRLLARPDLLRADVLKVPHHGGNTNAEGFIEAVAARTAVIGVGADNDYGHPAPEVLADLEAVRVLRTDVGGTVSVTVE